MITSLAIAILAVHANSPISAQQPAVPGKVTRLRDGLQTSETVYVADRGAQRIVKLDNLAGAGWATLTASSLGLNSLQVSSVATDQQGRIYFCANGTIHRVNSITGQGHVSMSLPSGAGTNSQIFVRSNGWIYVTLGNTQVVAFDMIGPTATQKWQSQLSGLPNDPFDLFVDAVGNVTVAGETVISGGSSYPGIIIELKASGGNPLSFVPITTLRGVTRDAKGKIYYASANGIGRIDGISGANPMMMSTSHPVAGSVFGSGRIYTIMPSQGKVGALSLHPSGAQSWFGSSGIGIHQFSNPVDLAVYSFKTNAL